MRILALSLSAAVLLFLGIAGLYILQSRVPGGRPVWAVPGGEGRQGREAMLGYGCEACHVIPGIRQARGRVGPKLEEIDRQIYIGGVLTNSPHNMTEWIRNPRRFSPETAMPNLDVSEQDALEIAAYLFRNR
jgi:cytochrome c2